MFKEITPCMVEEVRKHLHYNQDTGIFSWLVPTSKRVSVGMEAGRVNSAGHIGIGFNGSRWQAHRLAWAYVHGPLKGDVEIDHRDEVKTNNAIGNLRLASKQENSCNRGKNVNNTAGFKGVSYNQNSGKWEAYVNSNGKKYYLGLHDTPELAANSCSEKRKELHGEFAKE